MKPYQYQSWTPRRLDFFFNQCIIICECLFLIVYQGSLKHYNCYNLNCVNMLCPWETSLLILHSSHVFMATKEHAHLQKKEGEQAGRCPVRIQRDPTTLWPESWLPLCCLWQQATITEKLSEVILKFAFPPTPTEPPTSGHLTQLRVATCDSKFVWL